MSRFTPPAARLFAASVLSAVSLSAYAHSPYLLPSKFQLGTRNATISVDASLTDNFFIPDIAYGKHPFSATAPDGTQIVIPESSIYQLPTRTVVEHKLTDAKPGTYLVTAGPRASNPSRSWEINGETKRIRDPNEVMPAGAVLKTHTQSVALAQYYATVGPVADAAVPRAAGRGLEFVPVSHPNRLSVGGKFDFAVHYNGKPLPDHAVSLVYSNMDFSGRSQRESLKTDAQGRVSYALAKPGVYMASIRYAEDGPVRADKPNMSYSTSLTFNVTTPAPAPAANAGGRGQGAQGGGQAAGGRPQASGGERQQAPGQGAGGRGGQGGRGQQGGEGRPAR